MFNNKILENKTIVFLLDSFDDSKSFIEASIPYLESRNFKVFQEDQSEEKILEQIDPINERVNSNLSYVYFLDKKNTKAFSRLEIISNFIAKINNDEVVYIKNRYGMLETVPLMSCLDKELEKLFQEKKNFKDYQNITEEEKNMIELYYSY